MSEGQSAAGYRERVYEAFADEGTPLARAIDVALSETASYL